jgi:hypothetical protein
MTQNLMTIAREKTMRTYYFTKSLLLVLVMAKVDGAHAEVLDAAAGGFTTSHSVEISATRHVVYESLVGDVGKWWNSDHTVSGSAANMYLSARSQGCFCEVLGDGAGVVHMTVTFANPGVMLGMTGGLGPLGLMGVAGNMTFEIEETEGVSSVTLQYAVGGYMPGGLDKIAPAVDGVLVDVLGRLKGFVEADTE